MNAVLDKKEIIGLDLCGLSSMSMSESVVSCDTFSPLQFDRTEYTSIEQFVFNLSSLPNKPVRVSRSSLSVNGRCVADRMDKYLANPSINASALKEALKTPRHYLIYRTENINPRNTSHFELGTFCHTAFLEPSKFDKIIVEPEHNATTNDGLKALVMFYYQLLGITPPIDLATFKQPFLRNTLSDLRERTKSVGYTIIKEEDKTVINIIKATYKTYGEGILPKLMRYVQSEISMYGIDYSTGLDVKIRPDGIMLKENFGVNAILSVKTTNATSIEAFLRDCAKYKYELSEGMYLDVASSITGRKFTATLMIMLQTIPPFQVALIYWNDEDLQIGKYKYHQALDIVRNSIDTNNWMGFDCKAEQGAYGIIQGKLPNYIKLELPPQLLTNE